MISSKLVRLSSTLAPGIVSNCPSRWRDDQNGVIQVTWAAPQQPNGVLLRYYIQLTRYDDGRTVIASASTDEDATLSVALSAANLGKCCSSCNPDNPFPCFEFSITCFLLKARSWLNQEFALQQAETPGVTALVPYINTEVFSPDSWAGYGLQHIQFHRSGHNFLHTHMAVQSISVLFFSDSAEDGVPYNVSIFAETSAGNGTKCNVTDFTNELCKFGSYIGHFYLLPTKL